MDEYGITLITAYDEEREYVASKVSELPPRCYTCSRGQLSATCARSRSGDLVLVLRCCHAALSPTAWTRSSRQAIASSAPEIVLASATVRRGMRSIPGLWTRPFKVGGVRTSIPFQSGACTAVVPTARP